MWDGLNGFDARSSPFIYRLLRNARLVQTHAVRRGRRRGRRRQRAVALVHAWCADVRVAIVRERDWVAVHRRSADFRDSGVGIRAKRFVILSDPREGPWGVKRCRITCKVNTRTHVKARARARTREQAITARRWSVQSNLAIKCIVGGRCGVDRQSNRLTTGEVN